MKNIKKSGFTLIELLVVIAIIGLLATIAMTVLNTARRKSKVASTNMEVEQYHKSLSLYYDDNGYYPVIPQMIANGTSICLGDYAPAETSCGNPTLPQWYPAAQDFEAKLEKYIPALPKSVANCPGSSAGKFYNYVYTCRTPLAADPYNKCAEYVITWVLETSDPKICNILGLGAYASGYQGYIGDKCVACQLISNLD